MEVLRSRLQAALGDRYALEELLGSGGTGTVFAAVDRKHDRRVALKVLRPEFSASVGTQRFLREIHIAAGLTHPHIVPLFDSGEADGLLYYVMALVEGESLQELLDREDELPVARALKIAREVAEALSYAHDRDIVHRDVKPGNILLAGDHALLADFGVARAAVDTNVTLTGEGIAIGTPAYMSPEQILGEQAIDARSDVYSLGCVLFEMLTGKRPFRSNVLAGRVMGTVPTVTGVRRGVPSRVAQALERALAPDPADRFQRAAEFGNALNEAGAGRRHVWAAVAAVALLGAAALLVLDPPWGGAAADLTDRAGSVVVLPFRDATQTPDEVRIVVDLANELTRQLNRWDSIRAVPQVALAGVTFDLGIRSPALERLDDGLSIARTLKVETMIALNARVRGDSVFVSATRFDVAAQGQVGRPLESHGPRHDPFQLAAGIVQGVLGLTGSVDEVENLRRRSSNPLALQRYDEGRDLMARWRLPDAERAFREAVALDSTFAMAHHYLAVVLYWEGADATQGLSERGPEAVRLSRAALRHSDDLTIREREHVLAFNRFLEGDYEVAREQYADLLARDSTDVYAWLLAGIVEFQDPWLTEGADGSLHPRGDLNAAVRDFTETTRLNPGFHLGYGHLFDITELALSASTFRQGFERPRDELVPVWESRSDPGSLDAFGLVYADSLVWMDEGSLLGANDEELQDGARRLLDRSLRTLRRWAAYAPDEPRPHAELATWTVRQREVLSIPQRPEVLDSLAQAALDQAQRALALQTDTMPDDAIQLANLFLATGQTGRAHEILAGTLDGRGPDEALSRAALNVPSFTGDLAMADDALELVTVRNAYWKDPGTDRLMDDGGTGALFARLGVLGAMGATERIVTQFADLEARLSAPSDSRMPLPTLRSILAPGLAAALAENPAELKRWKADIGLQDALWDAIDPAPPDRLGAVRTALADTAPEVPEPERSYLLGNAALQVGEADLSVRLLSRLDSIPLSIGDQDLGWALKALSLFRRGEACELLGDTADALGFYQRFVDTRISGDGSAPLEARARERIAELTPGGR